MASVGHIVVGMAAARVEGDRRRFPWSTAVFWASLSMLPDADVLGLALGVDYASPWGHRGATHSFAFAATLGLVIGLAARWSKRPPLATGLLATVVLASHGVLDTL